MATLAQVIAAKPAIKALGQNYPAIAAALNAPTTIANPVTVAPKVAAPIALSTVWAQVPSAERVAARSMAGFVQELQDAIALQDRGAMAVLLEDGVTAGAIKPATAAKLQALLTATVADPTYSATIPGPSIAAAAGLGTVTAEQVQSEDNRLGLGGKW